MLGKWTAPEKLVNTMNGQKSSNIGTRAAGYRDSNGMSCDHLEGKTALVCMMVTNTELFWKKVEYVDYQHESTINTYMQSMKMNNEN